MIFLISLLGLSSSLSLFVLDYLKLLQNGYEIVCFDKFFSFASFLGLLYRIIGCDDLNYFYFCFSHSSLNSMSVLSLVYIQ